MNGGKVVSAQFVKVYQLGFLGVTGNGEIKAYKSIANGKLIPFDDESKIPEGSTIYLIATPNTGNDLLTWTDTTTNSSVKNNTALKTSFVMNSNHQISATFATSHTFTYTLPTITSNGVDSFQASRYGGKILAFRDPAFKDTIKDGSLVAQGLKVYAKAILPDLSFDVIWNINGTSNHVQRGIDIISFLMPTSNFNFIAELQQQGYDVTINASTPPTTLKYKYGKIQNFTDYHNTTSGTTFKFPRGYTVILQATSAVPSIWTWSTNVSTLLNAEKEQQVQVFIFDINQNINFILSSK